MNQYLAPSVHDDPAEYKPDMEDITDQKEREGYYPIPNLDPHMKTAGIDYKDVVQE